MSKKKYVKMQKRGEVEGMNVIEVMPSAVKVWDRRGWTVVDDGSSETPDQRDQQQLSLLDDENKE